MKKIVYILILFSKVLSAQEIASDSSKQSTVTLSEVVISATRWEQPKNIVSKKITILKQEEVQLLNPQTAADLLGSTGEVFIQKSQQGGGSPMIRGFATNRLLYCVDGIRMNTAIFRAGNIQNVISLDPFAIEKTEILFGPGSTIYGSDAIGGVMSFTTLNPKFSSNKKREINGKTNARFSSANNEGTGHFDFTIAGQKWATLSSFTYTNYGDLKMGAHGPDDYLKPYTVKITDSTDLVIENKNPNSQTPSGYSQINIMQKIKYAPSKKWILQYDFHHSKTSEYARYDRLIETKADGSPTYAVWNYGPQKWQMNAITITHKSASKLFSSLNIKLAQQYFEESRIDRKLNHFRLRTQTEKVFAYSANVDFLKQLNSSHLFYGLEAINNVVISTGEGKNIYTHEILNIPSRYPNSTWTAMAAYIHLQKHWKKIIFNGGARYSFYQIHSDFSKHAAVYGLNFSNLTLNNNAITGSLGMLYRKSKSLNLSLNASTAYRAPNVDDMGKMFDFVAGTAIVPNPNLKAEYAYNGEFIISKNFKEKFKMETGIFYTYLDNAMLRREFKLNGEDSIVYEGELSKVYAIQNAAMAIIYGINASFNWELPKGFYIGSKINYQKGTEEMENGTISPSRHTAPWFGVSKLGFQTKKLHVVFHFNYCAEVSNKNLNPEEQQKIALYAKDLNGNPYSPQWYTLNLKAMYQLNSAFSLSAGVENISDQRYRPYSSGIAGAGRNFIVALNAKF